MPDVIWHNDILRMNAARIILAFCSALTTVSVAETHAVRELSPLLLRAPVPQARGLGKRWVTCDDGSDDSVGRDAIGDLMGNKFDRKPLITASVMEVDFGRLNGTRPENLGDAIRKVERTAETKSIRRPFRFSSIAIPYHNGRRWMGCFIILEKRDEVVAASPGSSHGDGTVELAKKKFHEDTFERADGKLQTPTEIVDNPEPSTGKRNAIFEKALGEKQVACAEGESRGEAGRKLLEEQVFDSVKKGLKTEIVDFGKLTPSDLNNQPAKASTVLAKHEELLPAARDHREVTGSVVFFAPRVAVELNKDKWKVCLVVE